MPYDIKLKIILNVTDCFVKIKSLQTEFATLAHLVGQYLMDGLWNKGKSQRGFGGSMS